MNIFESIKNKISSTFSANINSCSTYSFENLYTAKFLNWYRLAVQTPSKNSDFPQWMKYECGVEEPLKKQKQLLTEGFLKQCSFEETLHKLTVPQLKDIIRSQGLPNANKKADLIAIISANANRSIISLPVGYTTSEKGNSFLEENEELLSADSFKVYDVSVEEYFNEAKSYTEGYNSLDVVKSILNKRIAIYSKQKNFGFLRNVYLKLAEIAEREKDYSCAIKNYIFTTYYDVTGLGNNNSFSPDDIFLAPAVIKAIEKYKDLYTTEMISECKELYVPRSCTSIKEFEKLIKKILNNEPIPDKFN